MIEQQMVWLMPEAADVDTGVVGRPLPGKADQRNGKRIVRWITGNLPPVRGRFVETPWSRVLAPGDTLGSELSSAMVAVLCGWSFAGGFFGAQWEEAWGHRSGDVDRMAAEATTRFEDPAARAKELERLTRTRVRSLAVSDYDLGMRPLPATQVLLEHAGGSRDKCCLLVALLRSAGIEASPAMIRLRPDSLLVRVPSLAQFDRFLVRAHLSSGEYLWLDPTDRKEAIPPGKALLLTGQHDPYSLRQEAGLVSFPGLPAAH